MCNALLAGALLACAMVLADVQAAVIVTQAEGGARTAQGQLALLDHVRDGETIELAAGASLVVFERPGSRQWTLGGPGRFKVGHGTLAQEDGTLRLDAVDPAIGRALLRSDQALAGAILRFEADRTARTERVAPSMPLLRWCARPHKGPYIVRLRDEAGQALFETQLAQTELTLPDTVRLVPGLGYQREVEWQEPDGTARFERRRLLALGTAQDAELAALYPAADAPAAARVLYVLYLYSLGVRALADHLASGLPEKNPSN